MLVSCDFQFQVFVQGIYSAIACRFSCRRHSLLVSGCIGFCADKLLLLCHGFLFVCQICGSVILMLLKVESRHAFKVPHCCCIRASLSLYIYISLSCAYTYRDTHTHSLPQHTHKSSRTQRARTHTHTHQEHTWLVSCCFKPSQPQRITPW